MKDMQRTEKLHEIIAKAQLQSQDSLDDWEELYIDDDSDIALTRETLEDFRAAAKDWQERSGFQSFEVEGYACISWESMQALKGQQRESMVIVDFGDFRAAYKF
tara:strand:- start:200 stop:511 length:312 start_codon:yes stop_codon:yes gene_type:complete